MKSGYGTGPVSVPCSVRIAEIVADWLERDFTPREPTLLGGTEVEKRDCAAADELAEILAKAARRKRASRQFRVELKRELADWFVSAYFAPTLYGLALWPRLKSRPGVQEFANECRNALARREHAGQRKARLSAIALRQKIEQAQLGRAAEAQLRRMKRRAPKLSRDNQRALRDELTRRSAARPDPKRIRVLKRRLKTEQFLEEVQRSGHTLLTWPGRSH